MGLSEFDPAFKERQPWNAGVIVGPKRPLKPRDVWAIRFTGTTAIAESGQS